MSKARARHLRRTMTEGERRLWQLLRRKQLAGFRFRRQAPIRASASQDAKQASQESSVGRYEIRATLELSGGIFL